MDWAAAGVGIGGLLVAALSLVLSYRERQSPYRHRLYELQLDALREVLPALATWYDGAQNYIVQQPGAVLSETNRNDMRGAVFQQHLAYQQTLARWQPFLPDALLQTLAAYSRTYSALSVPVGMEKGYDPAVVHAADAGMVLADAYEAAKQAARAVIGTEPLTRETRRLIGTDPRRPSA